MLLISRIENTFKCPNLVIMTLRKQIRHYSSVFLLKIAECNQKFVPLNLVVKRDAVYTYLKTEEKNCLSEEKNCNETVFLPCIRI